MTLPSDCFIRVGARPPSVALPSAAAEGARSAPRRPPPVAETVIVGAGVIGLSIGWRLAAAGVETVIFERDEAGSGASLAATGMLAAASEFEAGGEDLLPFALLSQRSWPAFKDELQQASGINLGYDDTGTLVVALTRDEMDRLGSRFAMHRRSGLATGWLSGGQARDLEPGLRPSTAAALHCAQDHQVDPRRLLPALRFAFQQAGGVIVEHCGAVELVQEAGRCTGVSTQFGACRASHIILAAGAWANEALHSASLTVPVRPIKGQSIALRTTRLARGARHVIWTEQVHMAPKSAGGMIVGATMEECGFDPSISAGGVFALLEGMRRALPGADDMEIEAMWSGFRPTSQDDAPILGEAPLKGLILAVGHHRNGILLAPATAAAISRLILEDAVLPEASTLGYARFGRA